MTQGQPLYNPGRLAYMGYGTGAKKGDMRRILELMSLAGRVALISGGAGHIGRAAGEALAELGAAVAVLDLAPGACRETAQHLENTFQVPALALPVDLADQDQVRAAPAQVANMLGRLDILINCAALVGTTPLQGWAVPLEQQSVETWRRALEVNLTSVFVLCQAAAPLLAQHELGSIINVASTYAMVAPDMSLYEGTEMGNPAAYGASKAGLINLTRYLATSLAPKVRVNALTPGGVWRNQPEPFHQRYQERTPLGRMAREEDFKGAFAYLASDLSAYVTGANLVVDGGWTIW